MLFKEVNVNILSLPGVSKAQWWRFPYMQPMLCMFPLKIGNGIENILIYSVLS